MRRLLYILAFASLAFSQNRPPQLSGTGAILFPDTAAPPHYLRFIAPSTAANTTWVWPGSDGGAGTVLSTDGAGNLSWISSAAASVAGGFIITGDGNVSPPNTSMGLQEYYDATAHVGYLNVYDNATNLATLALGGSLQWVSGSPQPQLDFRMLGGAAFINGSVSGNGNIVFVPGNVATNASVIIKATRTDEPALQLDSPAGVSVGTIFTTRDSSAVAKFWIMQADDASCPSCVVATGSMGIGQATNPTSATLEVNGGTLVHGIILPALTVAYNLGDVNHLFLTTFTSHLVVGDILPITYGGVTIGSPSLPAGNIYTSGNLIFENPAPAPQIDATSLGAALQINGSSSGNGDIVFNPGAVAANASVLMNATRADQPALRIDSHAGTTVGTALILEDHSGVGKFWVMQAGDAACPSCVVATGSMGIGQATNPTAATLEVNGGTLVHGIILPALTVAYNLGDVNHLFLTTFTSHLVVGDILPITYGGVTIGSPSLPAGNIYTSGNLIFENPAPAPQIDATSLGAALQINGSSSGNGDIVFNPGAVATNASVLMNASRADQPALRIDSHAGTTVGTALILEDHSGVGKFWVMQAGDASCPSCVVATGSMGIGQATNPANTLEVNGVTLFKGDLRFNADSLYSIGTDANKAFGVTANYILAYTEVIPHTNSVTLGDPTRSFGPVYTTGTVFINNSSAGSSIPFGFTPLLYGQTEANPFPIITTVFSGGSGSAANQTYFQFSARGTASSPSAVQTGDSIGGLRSSGYGSTTWGGRRANLMFWAAENWTDSAQGTYLTLETTPIGSAGTAERLRIDPSGNVGINTSTINARLEVAGNIGVTGDLIFRSGSGAPQIDATNLGAALNINGSNSGNGNIALNPGPVSGASSVFIHSGTLNRPALIVQSAASSGTAGAAFDVTNAAASSGYFFVENEGNSSCGGCTVVTQRLAVGQFTDPATTLEVNGVSTFHGNLDMVSGQLVFHPGAIGPQIDATQLGGAFQINGAATGNGDIVLNPGPVATNASVLMNASRADQPALRIDSHSGTTVGTALILEDSNGIGKFWILQSGDAVCPNCVNMTSLLQRYNNVLTQGMGLPPIYASVSLLGQSGNIINSPLQVGGSTAPAGSYEVSMYIECTSGNSVLGTIQWNDAAGLHSNTLASCGNGGSYFIHTAGVFNIGYTTSVSSTTYNLYVAMTRYQ